MMMQMQGAHRVCALRALVCSATPIDHSLVCHVLCMLKLIKRIVGIMVIMLNAWLYSYKVVHYKGKKNHPMHMLCVTVCEEFHVQHTNLDFNATLLFGRCLIHVSIRFCSIHNADTTFAVEGTVTSRAYISPWLHVV